MLLRKNTKAFKTIVEIIAACKNRPDRGKLIRLYITKAGHSIRDRIGIEGIEGKKDLFYEMNYQAILNNLKSTTHQLHLSDDAPGIYFFHSTSNKVWDETPFEFDPAIKKTFKELSDLPVFRKREKAEKFVFPSPTVMRESKPTKKETSTTKKAAAIIDKGPKQPDYKLKQNILFTNLDQIVFRQAGLNKKHVLDYYNRIAEYILPYLKDRPQVIRLPLTGEQGVAYTTLAALRQQKDVQLPDWFQGAKRSNSKDVNPYLFCNDKEHLLFYAEIGCLAFYPSHSRAKSIGLPDYIVIVIDSPGSDLGTTIDVALAAKEVLAGLQLPSFVKTDGMSGLHIYIPLDAKSEFETGRAVADYICKLVRLKVPELAALKGSDDHSYGKVSVDYRVNEAGKGVVAPYSLMPGESAAVVTPLHWEEVNKGLRLENFNHETIFERLTQTGDPFKNLLKKKINANAVLERMEANYSFLF